MNLRQLEVFHAVMRAGTVTGAARLLGVTQPSVSTVLKHCEAQLRIPLFRRTGGGCTRRPRPRPSCRTSRRSSRGSIRWGGSCAT